MSPQWGLGRPPAVNTFLEYFEGTERSFLHVYADALSLLNIVPCHIWGQRQGLGQLPPSNLEPPMLRADNIHTVQLNVWNSLPAYLSVIFSRLFNFSSSLR